MDIARYITRLFIIPLSLASVVAKQPNIDTLGDPDDTLQYIWCIEGKWKLIKCYQGKDISSHYSALHTWDKADYHLHNILDDPNELNDLAGSMPERVEQMSAKIEKW